MEKINWRYHIQPTGFSPWHRFKQNEGSKHSRNLQTMKRDMSCITAERIGLQRDQETITMITYCHQHAHAHTAHSGTHGA